MPAVTRGSINYSVVGKNMPGLYSAHRGGSPLARVTHARPSLNEACRYGANLILRAIFGTL